MWFTVLFLKKKIASHSAENRKNAIELCNLRTNVKFVTLFMENESASKKALTWLLNCQNAAWKICYIILLYTKLQINYVWDIHDLGIIWEIPIGWDKIQKNLLCNDVLLIRLDHWIKIYNTAPNWLIFVAIVQNFKANFKEYQLYHGNIFLVYFVSNVKSWLSNDAKTIRIWYIYMYVYILHICVRVYVYIHTVLAM